MLIEKWNASVSPIKHFYAGVNACGYTWTVLICNFGTHNGASYNSEVVITLHVKGLVFNSWERYF